MDSNTTAFDSPALNTQFSFFPSSRSINQLGSSCFRFKYFVFSVTATARSILRFRFCFSFFLFPISAYWFPEYLGFQFRFHGTLLIDLRLSPVHRQKSKMPPGE